MSLLFLWTSHGVEPPVEVADNVNTTAEGEIASHCVGLNPTRGVRVLYLKTESAKG